MRHNNPEGWEERQLEGLLIPAKQSHPTKLGRDLVRYVDVSSVSRETLRIVSPNVYRVKEAPGRARKIVKAGDVIFATIRPALRRVAIVPQELDGELCSTAFCVLRPDTLKVDGNFLFFAASSPWFVETVARNEGGASYPAVTDNQVRSEKLLLPPIEEQRAIAEVLMATWQAKGAAERVIAATTELKKSLMRHLFSFGPVPLNESSAVRLKPSAVGNIPEHWEVRRFDSLFHSVLGKMLSPDARRGKNPKPYLRNVDVQWGKINTRSLPEMDFKETDSDRYGVRPGDVLICEGGEVGRAAVWTGELQTCYFQKALHRCRPATDLVDGMFLQRWFEQAFRYSDAYGEVGTKTTIAHLPGIRLKALPLPIPPRAEQEAIVHCIATVESKMHVEEARLVALDAIFQSLLHHLMTGQLRVPPFGS